MKAKIKYLHFQRNGVHGEPFYHCLATIKDDISRDFVITFRADQKDKGIAVSSCRVVCIAEIGESWRGDEIAYSIIKALNEQMKDNGGTIYDCCTKQELYTV